MDNPARKGDRSALSKRAIAGLIIGAVLLIVIIAAANFLFTGHMQPDDTALAALESDSNVQVVQQDGEIAFLGPDRDPDNTYGLVFYPGAKVDYRAYAPLLHKLASHGWICVDVSMPLDLAILNQDAATNAMSRYPQVEHWYIAGHSLGGAMAANYASSHADGLEGLVLLAAYSTQDISGTSLDVMSVYGSNDGVLNRENYASDRANLPASTHELVIDGGNHAQFGSYGEQQGDGTASISAEQQRAQTVRFIQKTTRQ
ncbi:MAG: alpha/beta hydrolase [Eggerthellaceae bacterium]|jgi:hypothetical protein